MATRDLRRDSWEDADLPPEETFLPPFPRPDRIQAQFPGLKGVGNGPSRAEFLHWVDFTLENPDEIWENDGIAEGRFYHYLSFVEQNASAPVFAVEALWFDDYMEINNFGLILDEMSLEQIRSGAMIYSQRTEWERDRLIRALNERALKNYDEGRLLDASQLIDRAIELSGYSQAYLYNNRGLIRWKMGLIDQAKKDFLEAIDLDSSNGDPHFNIGLIYFDEARLDEALQFLSKAVELNPGDSQFLVELGHLNLELNQESIALELFEQAFQKNPGDPQAYFHLGYYFLYKKNQPSNAVEYYHRGLRRDPDDQYALADFALAQWALGNKRKALRIRRALQAHPRLMPYTVSRLVRLNLEMGEYEAALRFYRRALKLPEPFEPEWLHYHAAVVYAKTGRKKQALDILKLAVGEGGAAVLKRAMSDEALAGVVGSQDFKKLKRAPGKRGTR